MIHVSNTLRAAVLAAAVCLAQAATAATLAFDATMHASPDDKAEIIGTLPAGSSVTPVLREDLAAAGIAEPPPGWIAVRHAVAVEGYVRNKDIGKDLAMKPDSPIFVEAAEGSAVLATVGPKDPVETGDPVGRFSKATLRKEQIVYVNSVPPESRAMVGQQVSLPVTTPTAPTAPAAAPAPVPKSKAPAVPVTITAAPRTFEGYLMRTRRILGQGPKLDYQLVDENNQRIALLDVSALLVTEPIEFFEGRFVKIYGPGLSMEGVTDAIIRVENLRLAR
jgi:hypothetical protein